ncbi:ABC transporter [Streptomyces abyssalis]|uniref:ABC transporter n=1 Tax=Streptomyces abyssalis TaxID=933944 RepID=A0A1E7JI78_9ACTN|nr:ABC transporter [Streptomyces abyssalis]OEU86162.1 ABC transporter [Streptomyces abyssalis]OEU92373.1 ABC transporter [Streptomyces abyssalis]
MKALLAYQTELLVRSQRWLPPLLLYVAFLGLGIQSGGPLLDALGYAAAALLPVTAWLVRICVGGEAAAARHCTAAAAGPWRVHLASVLTALLAACVLGAVATLYAVAVSDPHSSEGHVGVPVPQAAGAGLLAVIACALLGTAVGALCNRPVLSSTGLAVPSGMLAALLVLVAGGSPANAAVSGLVTGSHTGTVIMPWVPAVLSLAVAAAATAFACRQASRRS